MKVSEAIPYAQELTCLRFFPSGEAALAKVADVIAEVCRDEHEARALVDEMVSSFDEWPGPSHIRSVKATLAERSRGEWNPEAPKCQACGGTGWVEATDGKGNKGVIQCACHPARRKSA